MDHLVVAFHSGKTELSTGAETGSTCTVGHAIAGHRLFPDMARSLLGETASYLASDAINLSSVTGVHSFLERHTVSWQTVAD